MNIKILLVFFTLFLVFLFLFTGCQFQKIKVGIMTNLTSASEIGESEILMSKLYLKQNPDSKISLEYFNDAWDPKIVKLTIGQVLKRNIKFLLTTHTSTVANEVSKIIDDNKILTFVLGATTTSLSSKDDYHLRLINDVENEQRYIAKFINSLEVKTVLLFIDEHNKGYTYLAKDYLKKDLKKEIIQEIYLDATNFDIKKIENSINFNKFDIAYFIVGAGLIQIGSICQLIYNKDKNCKFIFTPWVMNEKLIKMLGDSYKNSIFSSFLPSPSGNKNLSSLKESFYSEYKFYPTIIAYKIYEALEILDYSFKNGYKKPENVKEFLIQKGRIQTYFETINLNKFGDFNSNLFFFYDLNSFYN